MTDAKIATAPVELADCVCARVGVIAAMRLAVATALAFALSLAATLAFAAPAFADTAIYRLYNE